LWALKGNEAEALRYFNRAVAAYPHLLKDFAAEFEALDVRDVPAARAFGEALLQRLGTQRSGAQ
jgi:hypothetical protein